MLDFLDVVKENRKGVIYICPSFNVLQTKDLMIKGGDFYAVWDDAKGFWSTNEFDAIKLIDNELAAFYEENKNAFEGCKVTVQYLRKSRSGSINDWHKFVKQQMPDIYHNLDERLIFSDTKTTRKDYASKKLSYPLAPCPTPAYDELMSTLYSDEERRKLEWAIGSVIAGDSKNIQKFVVLYGSAGTGKSTVLNIIQELFDGYWAVFDSRSLGSKSDAFALEPFANNPLVGIQHDGDLSHIEDNTRLNSLVSHETMSVNTKFKSLYPMKFNAFLFMGTNKPVKITDAKSGLLRRLIDISPTGNKIPSNRYNQLVEQVKFELGGIACRCLDIYKNDPRYYNEYVPEVMLSASNSFYNFVLDNFDTFEKEEFITLARAWTMYKEYASDSNMSFPMSKMIFKEELKNYFDSFEDRKMINGAQYHSIYIGFKKTLLLHGATVDAVSSSKFKFIEQHSLLDDILGEFKAQYSKDDETPKYSWDKVTTKLSDLDTSKLHYVLVPENHIVIDFDLKTADGKKSFKKNLEAANKWPKTYAELSKSGEGIHLHYIYDGDVKKLCRLYDEDIEIKVFTGKSSLRRKVTKCNDIPVATISSGLPLKEEVKVVSHVAIKDQKELVRRIKKCLNKEYIDIPSTASNVSFIKKMLDDAFESGMHYDVTALRPKIMTFATNSTHQAEKCMKMVLEMKFCSEEASEFVESEKEQLIFYDVEVFPNLFVVVWKAPGKDAVKMINPTPEEINDLTQFRLVGFNCRRYDNHILYARILGYSNEELYKVSQNIINKSPNAFFKEAYNLSYTDIYDFCSKKQSLKKWEIELGIHHQELGLPWDQPVPEELWTTVADYCINDVVATEAVFNARKGDWLARQILADVAGGSVNDTTNSLTTKIIFGRERHPKLVYTDLSKYFNGYLYEPKSKSKDGLAHNWYRGEDVGFGGYVYAEPGMYRNVVTFDIASQHPSSIIAMNCFGPYTQKFKDILDARIAIKHKDFDKARSMLDGKLSKHLNDESQAKNLAQALKIAINSVYGLTAAKFDNPFRDPRNENNIVALRGALFMVDLKHEVQDRGFTVCHIKTDSIKIVDPTPELCEFVLDYGKRFGYNFEIENKFDRICLVNDAVYVAKTAADDPDEPNAWTATGTQFAVPYVFKSLFSKEPLIFDDKCETKTVETALYLDMNEGLAEDEHNYRFVGKAGQFCPIKAGCGGGLLLREKDGKYSAATGTKGYRWLESEIVRELGLEENIDISYYEKLCDEAIATIEEYGDFRMFVDE